MATDWTPERIEALRMRAAEGYSTAQIATLIGAGSRCAVLGKAYRLGIVLSKKPFGERPLRSPPGPCKKVAHSASNGVVFPAISEALREASLAALHIPFAKLKAGVCHFPFGKRDYTYCGKPSMPGASYCSTCRKISIQPRDTDKRRAPTPARPFMAMEAA